MNTITLIGMSLVFIYSLVKILDFFNIDSSTYSPYVLFLLLILVSSIVLPKDIPSP
jgi:hypothetical protein